MKGYTVYTGSGKLEVFCCFYNVEVPLSVDFTKVVSFIVYPKKVAVCNHVIEEQIAAKPFH